MTGYLLDTNFAAALLQDHPRAWAQVRKVSGASVGIAIPAVGELWFMVHNSRWVDVNSARLREMLGRVFEFEYDHRAAEEFGRIKTELRRIGRPIPPIDIQIAAIARCSDLIIVTADRHFTFVQGLTVENWLESA